jgi:hypothetical protein
MVIAILQPLSVEERKKVLARCKERDMFADIGGLFKFSFDLDQLEALRPAADPLQV